MGFPIGRFSSSRIVLLSLVLRHKLQKKHLGTKLTRLLASKNAQVVSEHPFKRQVFRSTASVDSPAFLQSEQILSFASSWHFVAHCRRDFSSVQIGTALMAYFCNVLDAQIRVKSVQTCTRTNQACLKQCSPWA
jgi:hypothetical protein